MSTFDLASARAAAEDDRTSLWVGEFLASAGSDNAVLAAELVRTRHWWAGPLRIRLDHLVKLAGPEPDALVRVGADAWARDVDHMRESLEDGWEPPPLIAEFRSGRLLLQDGNHRYDALLRAEERYAWVLIYFDDPREREQFVDGLEGG